MNQDLRQIYLASLPRTPVPSPSDLPLCVKSHKLAPRCIGPFPILKVFNRSFVRLKVSKSSRIHHTFHVSRIKPVLVVRQHDFSTLDILPANLGPSANYRLPQLSRSWADTWAARCPFLEGGYCRDELVFGIAYRFCPWLPDILFYFEVWCHPCLPVKLWLDRPAWCFPPLSRSLRSPQV